MPKAGFWASGGYKISFRRDGCWYADDEVIVNRRIARLFTRHVCTDGEGGWVIDVGIAFVDAVGPLAAEAKAAVCSLGVFDPLEQWALACSHAGMLPPWARRSTD